MRHIVRILVFVFAAPVLFAEPNPLSAHNRLVYRFMKTVLLASAERMPEADYGFRPADSVRTFGQLVGHVAESQYSFCAVALGEKSPGLRIENEKTSKADLIAALKDAVKYCDRAYDGMTDAEGMTIVKMMRRDVPKTSVLSTNAIHTSEHYGNMVTYLRMKNLVPPSSDAEVMKQMH